VLFAAFLSETQMISVGYSNKDRLVSIWASNVPQRMKNVLLLDTSRFEPFRFAVILSLWANGKSENQFLQ
jgi:hypothetical protein